MSFGKGIRSFASKATAAHDKITREATLDLFGGVIKATPVGNPDNWKNPEAAPPGYVGGRARGNWQVTIGSPASGEVDRVDEIGDATMADAEAKTPPGAGQVVLLTNNLPYIEKLEYGHSSQAEPGAMVRKNVARVQKMVDRLIRKNKV